MIATDPSPGFHPPPSHDDDGEPFEPPPDALSYWVTVPGAIEFRSRICPLPMPTRSTIELMRLHGFYRDRVLPFAGGLYDQPYIYSQAMQMIQRRLAAAKGRS